MKTPAKIMFTYAEAVLHMFTIVLQIVQD